MVGKSLEVSANLEEAQEAVKQLQSNNSEAIAANRKHHRFDIRIKVIVQPGDLTQRNEMTKLFAECHDISKGGCRLLVREPLQLGSIYWIQFDPNKFQSPPAFARCVRGHLLREDALEFGMSFLTPIELPDTDSAPTELL